MPNPSYYERDLLIGGPSTGKTHQLICLARWLEDKGKEMWLMDCEDKVAIMLGCMEDPPTNIHLSVAVNWDEIKAALDRWEKEVKPRSVVAVDRIDLWWRDVQHWYSQKRYEEELADRMVSTVSAIKKRIMYAPRFERGDWSPINEQYNTAMWKLLYGFRSHVVMTAGVRGVGSDEVSPFEVFGHLGITPRGQNELAHQPNTAFLLRVEKVNRELIWRITTAKPISGRPVFEDEVLFDWAQQYCDIFWNL